MLNVSADGMDDVSGDCAAGWYCTGKSFEDKPTPPVNATDLPDCVCPAADYVGGQCWPGTFCPAGSNFPTQCTKGMYCDVSVNVALILTDI